MRCKEVFRIPLAGLSLIVVIVAQNAIAQGTNNPVLAPSKLYAGASTHPFAGAMSPTERAILEIESQRGVAVWREAAGDIKTALKEYAKEFAKLPEVNDGDANAVRAFATVNQLALSVQKDIEASGQRKVVILSSHTLEAIGKLGLDLIRWAADEEEPARWPMRPLIDRLGGLSALATGLGQVIGSGKFDGESVKQLQVGATKLARQQLLDATEKQLRTQYNLPKLEAKLEKTRRLRNSLEWLPPKKTLAGRQSMDAKIRDITRVLSGRETTVARKQAAVRAARQQLEAKLMYLDFVPELAGAMAANLKEGRLTMDVVDRYSDAVIVLAATYLTFALPPSPFRGAIRDTIVAGSRFTRHATEGWFKDQVGRRFELLDEYARYQARQIASKAEVKRIDEYFTPKQLRDARFNSSQIAGANAQTNSLNFHLAKQSAGRGEVVPMERDQPLPPLDGERRRPPQPVIPISEPNRGDPPDGVRGVTVNPDPIFGPMKSDPTTGAEDREGFTYRLIITW